MTSALFWAYDKHLPPMFQKIMVTSNVWVLLSPTLVISHFHLYHIGKVLYIYIYVCVYLLCPKLRVHIKNSASIQNVTNATKIVNKFYFQPLIRLKLPYPSKCKSKQGLLIWDRGSIYKMLVSFCRKQTSNLSVAMLNRNVTITSQIVILRLIPNDQFFFEKRIKIGKCQTHGEVIALPQNV